MHLIRERRVFKSSLPINQNKACKKRDKICNLKRFKEALAINRIYNIYIEIIINMS